MANLSKSLFDSFLSTTLADTRGTFLEKFHKELEASLEKFCAERSHGREEEWDIAYKELPSLKPSAISLDQDAVQIGLSDDVDMKEAIDLKEHLMKFHPWRKGPFNLFGTFIDTEWRSDWKWNRVQPHISSLKNRKVLDIGCGNGYHLFRMLGEGADLALGIDPTRVFLYQFNLIKRYLGQVPAYLLPLKSEHLPTFQCFDSVFSMGVLYHRRSPLDHLIELHGFLRPGGELILETLVVDEDDEDNKDKENKIGNHSHRLLVPADRYAKMANVWFLPTTTLLEQWLGRLGFTDVHTVDINQTSTEEQRSTQWMTFQSLVDFLDPNNPDKTIEGYPAPKRAICIATKPRMRTTSR